MKNRDFRITFTIRALLLLVLMIAIVCGVFAPRIARFRRLHELSSKMDSLGGDVSWVAPSDFIISEGRAHFLYPAETVDGREFFANLVSPRFLHVNLGKDNTEMIANSEGFADYVMSINCNECSLPDSLHLSSIAFVSINDPEGVSAATCLKALNPGSVKWLMIETKQIDNNLLSYLGQQTNLETLDIEVDIDSGLSEELFNVLHGLKKLEKVYISGRGFSAEQLDFFYSKK